MRKIATLGALTAFLVSGCGDSDASVILEESPTRTPSAVASPTQESTVIQCEDTGSACAELLRAYLVGVVGLPRSSVPNNRSLDAMGRDECDVLSRAQVLPDEDFRTIVRDLLQGIEPNDYAREILGGIVDVYCLDMRPRIDESGLGIPPYTPSPESNANENPNQGSRETRCADLDTAAAASHAGARDLVDARVAANKNDLPNSASKLRSAAREYGAVSDAMAPWSKPVSRDANTVARLLNAAATYISNGDINSAAQTITLAGVTLQGVSRELESLTGSGTFAGC